VHFENFTKIKTFKHKSLKIQSSLNLPIGHANNLGPIGSAVLTFIGYKQINKQRTHRHAWAEDKKIVAKRLNLLSQIF